MSSITLELRRNTHANVLSIGLYSYSIGGGGGGVHDCNCNHSIIPKPIMMMTNTPHTRSLIHSYSPPHDDEVKIPNTKQHIQHQFDVLCGDVVWAFVFSTLSHLFTAIH